MRAALFGQLETNSKAMGAMTETAIFSQWQHSKMIELYYARWKTGEIDIVHLNVTHQVPSWMVEVKWSDRPYSSPSELDNCVEFVKQNPSVAQPILITTKTIRDPDFYIKMYDFTLNLLVYMPMFLVLIYCKILIIRSICPISEHYLPNNSLDIERTDKSALALSHSKIFNSQSNTSRLRSLD